MSAMGWSATLPIFLKNTLWEGQIRTLGRGHSFHMVGFLGYLGVHPLDLGTVNGKRGDNSRQVGNFQRDKGFTRGYKGTIRDNSGQEGTGGDISKKSVALFEL